ncbi:hypothetical protein EK904_014724, partial [Melospiza melodia maxima]
RDEQLEHRAALLERGDLAYLLQFETTGNFQTGISERDCEAQSGTQHVLEPTLVGGYRAPALPLERTRKSARRWVTHVAVLHLLFSSWWLPAWKSDKFFKKEGTCKIHLSPQDLTGEASELSGLARTLTSGSTERLSLVPVPVDRECPREEQRPVPDILSLDGQSQCKRTNPLLAELVLDNRTQEWFTQTVERMEEAVLGIANFLACHKCVTGSVQRWREVFLLALSLAFLGKTMSGAYMNSMYTQIEKQFNIPASLVGIINGSFEIGNLLLIAFVSYFGAKLHRPRIIALGCTVLSFGCLLISLPHFLFGRYHIESSISQRENVSVMPLCLVNHNLSSLPTEEPSTECEQEPGSLLWIFVMVGNIVRGMGETPIMPLGISYLEDFAKAENSPFYLACLHTATVIGPFLGLLLASFCAELFVDIGSVGADEITIAATDARWVGAWWLGILICALLNLLVAIPFWFLPKSLVKEGETNEPEETREKTATPLQENDKNEAKQTMYEIAKGKLHYFLADFIPFLKALFHNPVYMLFICITVLQFSAFDGMISFMPKYLEQQFGKSASDAIFLIGVYNLPVLCVGYFSGGLFMKKFKINIYQAASIAFWVSLLEYLLYFAAYWTVCDTSPVAGLTVSYQGIEQVSYAENTLLAGCNMDCDCPLKIWDPVCGSNGITYVSPCLAGCKSSRGTGRSLVFENCTCVAASGFSSQNISATLGHCDGHESCDKMLHYFLILTLVCSFIFSLAAMPGYMVLMRYSKISLSYEIYQTFYSEVLILQGIKRSLKPEEKSFGVGIHGLASRVFAGIPSPIYFGALIDTTCLKWGTMTCGGEGACRMYDVVTYRWLYLGLPAVLRGVSYIPSTLVLLILKKQLKSEKPVLLNEPIEMQDKGQEANC